MFKKGMTDANQTEVHQRVQEPGGWDVAQKRQAVMTLRPEAYPVADICAVVGLARSTFYHAGEKTEAEGLRQALLTLAGEYPTYGYRRLTALLCRQGWQVNHKRIQRLMQQMGLQRPVKKRETRTTNSDHPFPRYPNLFKGETATKSGRHLGG
jgi:hypothetical protein